MKPSQYVKKTNFIYKPRQVYQFVDPTASEGDNLQYKHLFSDGETAQKNDYLTWTDWEYWTYRGNGIESEGP